MDERFAKGGTIMFKYREDAKTTIEVLRSISIYRTMLVNDNRVRAAAMKILSEPFPVQGIHARLRFLRACFLLCHVFFSHRWRPYETSDTRSSRGLLWEDALSVHYE